MQDIEDLSMPDSQTAIERENRLKNIRRNFKKKEKENKSSEMIENQKLFLQQKKEESQVKSSESCQKEDCCQEKPKNDFCGSEHDNWQPDIEFKTPQSIYIFYWVD